MSQQETNQAEWQKDENWTDGGKLLTVYFSHADSRVWVPKRISAMGWTLNLAKKKGVAWFLGLLLLPTLIMTGVVLLLIPVFI
ncbi:MAG: hypothetical protein GQ569_15225 [Methylococcaceae bacterium]|nr:hypothetical protein [Methylococcaceae bacterium]